MANSNYGRVLAPSHLTASEYLAFNSIPEPNSGCFLWLKSLSSDGYGNATVNGRWQSAHRLAWEAANGPVPPDMIVCHKCDVPSCVNPQHLWLGTHGANARDRDNKNRTSRMPGEVNPLSKIKEHQVHAIRADRRHRKEIAAEYGLSVSQISRIRRRVLWRHVR
jgi:hypothetical protein